MRFILPAFALLFTTPLTAATFHAQLVTPPAAKIMARDIQWRCGAAGCVTTSDLSSPRIACAGLARRVGQLQSFASNGVPFGAAALARCNARAR